MALERLPEKRPLQRKSNLTTDDQRCRLRRASLDLTLVQQIPITDYTTGVMGSECARSDQDCITPGERLLKNTTISRSTQLSSSSARWSQTTIETDSQHQTNRGALER